jgi:hypothetical protein
MERVESTVGRILSPKESEDGSSEKNKPTDVVDKAGATIGGLFDRVLSGGGKSESKGKSKKSEKGGKQNDQTDKSSNEAESTNSEPESTRNEPADRAEQAIDRVFDIVGKTTKAGDRKGEEWFGLSDEEERNWGQKLHQELLTHETPVKDAKFKRRIDSAVAPLLSRKKRDFDYKFTVLKNEEVNAFAFPGGYIYLTDSLLNFTKKEVELQFVLGHEIGHVDLRHCARRLMPLARASQVAPAVGSMAGVLHGVMSRTYAQDEEYDADEYSYKNLRAMRKSTPDILAFLRRLQTYEDQQDHSASPRDAASDPLSRISSRLNDHFRTHPPTEDRIRRLESLDGK